MSRTIEKGDETSVTLPLLSVLEHPHPVALTERKNDS